MPIEPSWEPLGDLAARLNAAEDRRLFGTGTCEGQALAAYAAPESSFEIRKNVGDPADGTLYVGGSSWTPGLPLLSLGSGLAGNLTGFSSDPLRGLATFGANFGGFDAVERRALDDSRRSEDFRRVLLAATQPGTPVAGAVARSLLQKSLKLASLADERAEVTQNARRNYVKLRDQVDRFDKLGFLLAHRGDVAGAEKMSALALEKARIALRFQKVNALASGLTENALGQATLAQRLAEAVLAGRPDLVSAYGVAYDKIAGHSEKIRGIRAQQLQKAKSGLADLEPTDFFEEDLDRLAKDPAMFSDLGDLEGKFWRKLKKKIFKPVGHALKKAAQKVGHAAAFLTLGLPCKLMKSKIVGQLEQTAGGIVGSVYGGPVGGSAGKIAAERSHKMNATMCKGLDKIGVTQGKFHKGAVKDAFASTAKDLLKQTFSPKEALKNLSAIGGSYASGSMVGQAGKVVGFDASKLLNSKLVGGIGQKALSIYSQKGGKDLLQLGSQAFKASGLKPEAYIRRMEQVAFQQVAGVGTKAFAKKVSVRAHGLVSGALKTPDLLQRLGIET